MALSETTGVLPAITHDQVDSWNKLANDVLAALQMGGEQGMNLLTSLMAEWCEAVDDVNSARQIVVDLADRGLRHEAIEWHASGFFEVADRLDPNRPGWEAWEAALEDRGIVTPRIDTDLREAANRIHEDLELRDLAGQSLAEYLGQLRKNVLVKGHLGDRMLLLESIRGLDPAGDAWHDMMSPIRRKRAGAVEDEARAAIVSRDFEALRRLRAEVTAADGWQDDVPGTLVAILEAASHWDTVTEMRRQISATAATLVSQCEEARRVIPGSLEEAAALEAAHATKEQYRSLRHDLTCAAESARAVPELRDVVLESGLVEAVNQLDTSVSDQFTWLDRRAVELRRRAEAASLEAAIHAHLKSMPAIEGDLERCAPVVRKWRQKAVEIEQRVRRKTAVFAGGPPPSTLELLQRLDAASVSLQSQMQQKKRGEKLLVAIVIGGVAAVALGLFVVVVVGSIFGK